MKRTHASAALAFSAILALLAGAETVHAAPWSQERSYIGRPLRNSDTRTDQNAAREGVRQGKILPLGKVLAKVHQRHPGRLLDAQLVDGGGRPVYLIKLMTADGSVAIVSADAATGEILGYRQGGR